MKWAALPRAACGKSAVGVAIKRRVRAMRGLKTEDAKRHGSERAERGFSRISAQ
jgi:hypothetical protein